MALSLNSSITASALRSVVTIRRPVGTESATGGVIEGTPEVFAERIPASIQTMHLFGASEILRAGGLAATITHVVRIRHLPGVKPWMTVTFENREFQIQTILDIEERHIEDQLFCVEIQA